MKHHFISAALAATVLLLGASLSVADENKAAEAVAPGSKAAPAAKSTAAANSKAGKKAAEPKLVDINSATPAELKKLPRIGDLEALKIIEGRPYGSKYFLVTDNVILEGVFMDINDRIEAVQPPKQGKKYMEQLKKAAEKRAAASGKKADVKK